MAVNAPLSGDRDSDGHTTFELATAIEGPWIPFSGTQGSIGVPGPGEWRWVVLGDLAPGTDYFVRLTYHDPDGVGGPGEQLLGPIHTPGTGPNAVTAAPAEVVMDDEEIYVAVAISDDKNQNSDGLVELALDPGGPWFTECGPELPFHPKACRIRSLIPGTSYWLRVTISDSDGVDGANPQLLGPYLYSGRSNLAYGRSVTADAGWGCCADPSHLVDARIQAPGWYFGFAWSGGYGEWAGGEPGWKDAVVDLGAPMTFDRAVIWPHSPTNLPTAWRLEASDDGVSWSELYATSDPVCRTAGDPLETGWSFPACAQAADLPAAVTARFVRYTFDDRTLLDDLHGWSIELEVLSSCGYSITPPGVSFGEAGGSATIAVSAATGCAWSATSESSWLTITGGASGSGNGTVGYSVASNPYGTARTGILIVAGERFEIAQEAADCAYTISPSSFIFNHSGGSGNLAVTVPAGCPWSATSQAAWINLTGGTSGSGDGTVDFLVAAHAGSYQRSGTLTIAGHSVSVEQNGINCSFSLNSSGRTLGSSDSIGFVAVSATAGCGWTAISHNDWLTIINGSSGEGNGTVGYSVAANTSSAPRTGALAIAGQSFTVEQPCVDPLVDGGFEGGTPSTTWSEASLEFDSPLCNAERCGSTWSHSGEWWAWLGGSFGAAEDGSLEQQVVIPESSALKFFLFVAGSSGNGADELRVKVDGVELFSVLEGDPDYGAGYKPVTVDLTGIADGGLHTVRFEVSTSGLPTNSNFFVDDLSIETCYVTFTDGFESGGFAAWSIVRGASGK
jgi:hypothetical protein